MISMRNFCSIFVGTGDGCGIALMFIVTGIMGGLISFVGMRNKKIKMLD